MEEDLSNDDDKIPYIHALYSGIPNTPACDEY